MGMTHEDVISWLEYLSDDARSKAGGLVPTNIEIACCMAIEALKAQEPRVMTVEEVLALPEDTPIYIENCDGPNGWDVYAGITKDADNDVVTGAIWATCEYWSQDEYGETWRCWTSRPTDEQMEAIPWN